METTARILIASRSQSALHALQSCFKDHAAFECSTRLISNGHADPLHGLAVTPDIVVLRIESGTAMELASWSEAGAELDTRPALVVVGPADNADSVRAVFRASSNRVSAMRRTATRPGESPAIPRAASCWSPSPRTR